MSLLGLVMGVSALGQENVNQLPAQPIKLDKATVVKHQVQSTSTTESVIWSEDFANGIPSTWTNQGFDGSLNPLASAVWEYRGTSTTPDVSQGTRGAFGATNDPILSTTGTNGFVIFDSDYLDNTGNSSNIGGGVAPAPHVGVLTTESIDLTGEPYIMLEFQNYARIFHANLDVALSTDGGATYPDTVHVYSDVSIGVNNATPNVDLVQYNLSSILGNQSNVKMQFIFDGRAGSAGANAYYFWMFDDVKLTELPRHALRFVENTDGAPKHDMSFGTTPGSGKYGIMTLKQVRPISFDSNVLNFGWDDQTALNLEVRVLDASQNVLQTLTSSSVSVLESDSIADYNDLNTAAWTPTAEGAYDIVYIAQSDSCNGVVAPIQSDTIRIYVTDSLQSLDFNRFNNRIGTNEIGDDGGAIATRLDLVEAERLFGVDIWLSTASVAGGVVEVTVYDTAGFDFQTGFPTSPLAYDQHTLTSSDISNGVFRADMTGSDGIPVYLSAGSYYIVATLYSNGGSTPVQLRNDQTLPQPAMSAIMYYTATSPRWYTGFINSLDLNAPHMRAVVCPEAHASACMTISVEESHLDNAISVYPNPATDFINLEFGDLNGEVAIRVADMNGRTVISTSELAVSGSSVEVSLAQLTPGIYVLSVEQGDKVSTFKLSVK